MKHRFTSWSLLATLTACSSGGSDGPPETDGLGVTREAAGGCVTPRSNLVVTTNTTLCPGSYTISDPELDGVIKIAANNVELVITGVTLTGNGTGYGIKATGVNGATIRSATSSRGRIKNFRSAILIEGGASHRVLENVLSNNIKKPLNVGDDFLGVWFEWPDQIAAGQVGNGIVLRNVTSATITNNQARFQQNGISLFDSRNVIMQGNDCSDNQGWGFQLHRSSNNAVINNKADNVNLDASPPCVQFQDGACDTAGILVIKGSNDNLVQGNSFKNGGDGIFAAATGPHDTIPNTQQFYGAERNRYIGNNVSNAKHHGIESTFADGVVVENNTVLDCGRVGVWLGGSSNSIIRNNTITRSGWSGILNQGARGMTVENNRITFSHDDGINLTRITHPDPLINRASTDYLIKLNTIQNNGGYGIRAEDTHVINATQNVLSSNGSGSVQLSVRDESSLSGPLRINESQLLDASRACGGVNVMCGGDCRNFDGNVEACDAAPNCGYWFCSNRCYPDGTEESVACPCQAFHGNSSACEANPQCDFYACSGQCHFAGTNNCHAGCGGSGCEPTEVSCPMFESITNVTSNWWGTTSPAVIDAAICGANLTFAPFKASP